MAWKVRVPAVSDVVSWLLVTFLVLFPKGGIRLGAAPLTWGYLVMGLVFVPMALMRILQFPLRQTVPAILATVSVVPFQALFIYTCIANGWGNLSYAVAEGTVFLFLPTIFLLVFPPFLRYVNGPRFKRQFCFCVFWAAMWGIFLFFYHPIMGKFVEIPYLTVNAGDYGLLESTKHIDRGGYLKLISTYNNGNVYGVATLILLPLYLKLEKSAWRRNTVRVALVMTLSRTVWAGLIVEQGLSLLYRMGDVVERFPRVRPGVALRQGIALLATIGLVLAGLTAFNSQGLAFLFNAGLGGREGELGRVFEPDAASVATGERI